MFINQNLAADEKPTPYDQTIIQLNEKLNSTYLYFSKIGKEAKGRQEKEDDNAMMSAPSVAVERAGAKATGFYNNSSWDLVDASKEESFDISKLKKEDLPEELAGMTNDQIKTFVSKKDIERESIKGEIKKNEKLRNDFLAKNNDIKIDNTFGSALLKSIKLELEQK
jgi:hypothetical protein